MILLLLTIGCFAGCNERDRATQADSTNADRIDPARLDAALQAAEDYLNVGDLINAEAILTRLVDRAPDDPRGFEMLAHTQLSRGVTARSEGDLDAATEHFENAYRRLVQVIELSPDEAGYRQSAGEIAQMLGDDDAALEHYLAARELAPRDPKPALMAAQILIERDHPEEAETAIRDVLAFDPDEPLAHVSLATLRLRQQQYTEALAAVREARDIDPAEVSFRVLEATILRQSGNPQAGLELLVPLGDDDRMRPMIAREIAACYLALDQPHDAARTWAFVYQSRPGHPEAWLAAVRAGEAMLEAGEVETARVWLHEARRTAEGRAEVEDFARRLRNMSKE